MIILCHLLCGCRLPAYLCSKISVSFFIQIQKTHCVVSGCAICPCAIYDYDWYVCCSLYYSNQYVVRNNLYVWCYYVVINLFIMENPCYFLLVIYFLVITKDNYIQLIHNHLVISCSLISPHVNGYLTSVNVNVNDHDYGYAHDRAHDHAHSHAHAHLHYVMFS